MIATLILFSACGLSLWHFRGQIMARLSPAASHTVATRRAPAPQPAVRAVAVAAPRPMIPPPRPAGPPDLKMLEWDGDKVEKPAAPPPAAPASPRAAAESRPAALPADPMRLRLRDRYIKARFPGVAESSADLDDGPKIVTAVRLYFGEQKFDRADELLDLAIEQSPGAVALRLAQLELAFLRRQAAAFTAFARDFHRAHPMDPAWKEVCRLGRAIAPKETALFGDTRGERLHDRYGPWPDMPNWLQASWDLTAEVLAADLHREMAQSGAVTRTPSQRNAA